MASGASAAGALAGSPVTTISSGSPSKSPSRATRSGAPPNESAEPMPGIFLSAAARFASACASLF